MNTLPLPGGSLEIRSHVIEYKFEDIVDPDHRWRWTAGGVTALGRLKVQEWVAQLFHDAEHVRRLSKRCRMQSTQCGGYGHVRFSSKYAAEEIEVWAMKLYAILMVPEHIKTLADITMPMPEILPTPPPICQQRVGIPLEIRP